MAVVQARATAPRFTFGAVMAFLICVACARHVKDSDAACPFCGAAMHDANRAGNPVKSARSRLAILFGATTALMTGTAALASCGEVQQTAAEDAGSRDAGVKSQFDGGNVVPYGLADFDAGADCGCTAIFYGAAIVDSGATDSGATDAGDANADDDAGD